jgi:hypothetical protein
MRTNKAEAATDADPNAVNANDDDEDDADENVADEASPRNIRDDEKPDART